MTTPTVHSTLFIQSSPLKQIKHFHTSETLDFLLFSLHECLLYPALDTPSSDKKQVLLCFLSHLGSYYLKPHEDNSTLRKAGLHDLTPTLLPAAHSLPLLGSMSPLSSYPTYQGPFLFSWNRVSLRLSWGQDLPGTGLSCHPLGLKGPAGMIQSGR